MNIAVITHLFFASNTFLLSILVLLKRWDEVARRWFYFSIFVAVYAIGYAFLSNNDISNQDALLASRIGTASAAVIPAMWLYFVCGFLNIDRRRIFYLVWPLTGLFVAVGLTRFFIPSVGPAKGFVHYPEPGPVYHVHAVNFFLVVIYGFYLMVQSYLKEKAPERKKEILSLSLATLCGFVGGSSEFSLIYLKDNGFDWTLLLLAYPFLTAYAMIKHRALDVEKIADAFQREKLAAIGILAASVNHELRNPLYIARGSLESYLQNMEDGIHGEDGLKEASRKTAETALRQLARAGEIMQRLTDFAKPYVGREDLEKVLLHKALKDVLELTDAHLRAHKINRTVEVGDEVTIVAHRRQLEEVLFNLIVNASQAMKEGGDLAIRAEQRNGAIRIEIQDQGPGIPSAELSKIFEPFYTTKESGTGLGLYITKQLVERNRGRISVESQATKGTRFVLKFPIASDKDSGRQKLDK